MNEEKIVDMDELIQYVASKTGIDAETVEKVFEAENDFLEENGLLEVEE